MNETDKETLAPSRDPETRKLVEGVMAGHSETVNEPPTPSTRSDRTGSRLPPGFLKVQPTASV